MTGIPLTRMSPDSQRLMKMEEELHKRVVSQDAAHEVDLKWPESGLGGWTAFAAGFVAEVRHGSSVPLRTGHQSESLRPHAAHSSSSPGRVISFEVDTSGTHGGGPGGSMVARLGRVRNAVRLALESHSQGAEADKQLQETLSKHSSSCRHAEPGGASRNDSGSIRAFRKLLTARE